MSNISIRASYMTLILFLGLIDFAIWIGILCDDRLVLTIPLSLVTGALGGWGIVPLIKLHIRFTDYLDRKFS